MQMIDPILGAVLIFFATSLGAAIVLLIKKITRKIYSVLLAFAAGVMGFSVIEMVSEASHYSLNDAALGFLLGIAAILILEKFIPHMHTKIMRFGGMRHGGRAGRHEGMKHRHGRNAEAMKKGAGYGRGMRNMPMRDGGHIDGMQNGEGRYGKGRGHGKDMKDCEKKSVLLAGAIILHNVPEGLAVGFAFASSPALGWLVATSIAIQDIPEGLLVSAPLACYGMRNKPALGFGILSGVVEAIAAILGFLFLSALTPLVPLALSLSAGAMAYVILVELLPDAFRGGMERIAGVALIAGFGIVFLLSQILAI
ncbi:MAG: ZIP family metal transporter [Candidatus Micrarchaeota archaeon]